jgi:mRNA-degrading endonuclease RelE of RelBE toxin-antitoxin system
MFNLFYREAFYKDLKKIKDKTIVNQIIKKTFQLEKRAPIGKKLVGYPYWSIHVNKYRIIYEIKGKNIEFYRLLLRKFKYRELRWLEEKHE